MTQALPTTCAHNYPGQVVKPGVLTRCRGCGAQITASPRTTKTATGVPAPSDKQVNAIYPGDLVAGDVAWASAQ